MITVTVKDKKISMSGHACRKDSSGIGHVLQYQL